MEKLYPIIEPYDYGLLDVGDNHKIYWEKTGNQNGIPILVLHGGPGAGGNKSLRQFFDPEVYNIIIFDQRGCGRSLPFASIEHNTTHDLVEDIEKIRLFLKIDKWIIFGGSWGSSLALVYSQKYPNNIKNIILRGIFLCRKHEIDWFLYGMKNIFPDYWKKFANYLPVAERDNLLDNYYRRLIDKNPKISQRSLANDLGLSLGKLNYCIKELNKKRLVKMKNFSRNKNKLNYIYILTPKGILKKTELTYLFLKRKAKEYEDIKKEYENIKNNSNG